MACVTGKAAVLVMAHGMAKEPGPDIRVNAMRAGVIDPDFHNVSTKPEKSKHAPIITPLKHGGLAGDVASIAVDLVPEESACITGACIEIDGGVLVSHGTGQTGARPIISGSDQLRTGLGEGWFTSGRRVLIPFPFSAGIGERITETERGLAKLGFLACQDNEVFVAYFPTEF